MLKIEKITLAGGAGFLGRRLVPALRKSEFSVLDASYPKFDLTRYRDCVKATRGADMVIHAAGIVTSRKDQISHPAEIFSVNLEITNQLLAACRDNGVKKILLISSSAAYSVRVNSPLKELELISNPTTLSGPLGFYGLSKWFMIPAGMSYAEQYGMEVVVVVPANMYGPDDKFYEKYPPLVPSLITGLYRAKVSGKKTFNAGKNPGGMIDLVHVDDVCSLIDKIVLRKGLKKFNILNAGGGKSYSIFEVCNLIAKEIGFDGKIVWEDKDGSPKRFLSNSQVSAELGWRPEISLKFGIRSAVKNFLDNHAEKWLKNSK